MADTPIIVTGGSVTLEFPKNLNSSSAKQTAVNGNAKLISLQVNDEPPRVLNETDSITIVIDDGT